jgi:hypothetical protein
MNVLVVVAKGYRYRNVLYTIDIDKSDVGEGGEGVIRSYIGNINAWQ